MCVMEMSQQTFSILLQNYVIKKISDMHMPKYKVRLCDLFTRQWQ